MVFRHDIPLWYPVEECRSVMASSIDLSVPAVQDMQTGPDRTHGKQGVPMFQITL